MPAVSVIVPFRDVRPYLVGCIESLLDQTLPRDSYELLFIDNNSTDGGAAAVAAHPDVRLLRETRQGAYAARNRGLAEARGEVIAFTDPDCQVERDWLERIAAAMSAPEVGIVLGRRVAATDHGLVKLVMAYESQKATYVTSRGVGELFFGHTNNMAVRRQVIERLGPFPELERGGDTVLVRRAVDVYGYAVLRYCPEVRVRHLEVGTLRSYYGKNRTYGESNERLRELVPFRPLTMRERWQVFRSTLLEQGWSSFRGALLLVFLIPGMLCYEWGRLVARMRRRRGGRPVARRPVTSARSPNARRRTSRRSATLAASWVSLPAMIGGSGRTWLRLARPRDWWISKVPFVTAATLLLVPGAPLARLLAMIGAVVAWAAFGFGLNEIADRHSDARAGKTNHATGLTRTSRVAFLLLTGGAALGLSAAWAVDAAAPILVLAGLGLAAAYSAPPLRLKERGLTGVAAAALAQWTLPVLAISAAELGGWIRPAAWSFALLGFAIGVRWMGVHQLNDAVRDRVAGVRTYAALGRPVLPLILGAFVAELVLLAAVLVLAWPRSTDAAATLAVWIATGTVRRNPVKAFRTRLHGYVDAPMTSYYFMALPMAMLLGRVTLPLGVWPRAALAAIGARVLAAIVHGGRVSGSTLPAPAPACTGEYAPEHPVDAALSFLEKRQRANGGFVVLCGRDPELGDGVELRCVFETAFVARILERWAGDACAARPLQRAREFLRAEREPSGLWRYFGRGSLIPADVDDTACALLVLPPDPADAAAINAILRNCDSQGAVLTWFLDSASGPPFRNCVDAAVNANVYTLLRRRSIDAPPVRRYLEEVLVSGRFLAGTPYYPSPFFFLYAMAGLASDLDPSIVARIEREVLDLMARGSVPSVLEAALACTALAACGADDGPRRPLLERIRSSQQPDGGWSAAALSWGMEHGRFWYGSRELTTAFCLEAIAPAEREPPRSEQDAS